VRYRWTSIALSISITSGVAAAEPLGASTPGEAAEHPASDQAKAAFEAGRVHYGRGEFRAAVEAFRAARALSAEPALLYDLAQAERLDGQCEEALTHYEEYVATYDGPKAPDVDEKIANMKRCVDAARSESRKALSAATTAARIENPDVAGKLESPYFETPGMAGSSQAPTRDAPDNGPPKWLGWTAVGVGAAGLVAGVVLAALTVQKQATVEEECPDKKCRSQAGLDAASTGRALFAGTITSLAVGAVGVGAGVYLLTRDSGSNESRQWSGAHGAVATYSMAF
jgi:tetratricopeptide (TPR) repeat protein